MNRSFEILAEVVFGDNAANAFNFPVRNVIRASIWFDDCREASPSEFIAKSDEQVLLNTAITLKIKIARKESLIDQIQVNHRFYIGPFSHAIGEGTILEVISA